MPTCKKPVLTLKYMAEKGGKALILTMADRHTIHSVNFYTNSQRWMLSFKKKTRIIFVISCPITVYTLRNIWKLF